MALLHGWRSCPRCAGSLEHGHERATCAACGAVYYANAAPTASALVEDERGRLLLGRRAIEPYDVAELAWFAPDELPPTEEIAFTQVADVLSAWRRRRQAESSEALGDQSVPADA